MTRRHIALAAAVIALLFTFTTVAVANHNLSYIDSQTTSSGNWIWWRTGFDWYHPDGGHFLGFAESGGIPSAGGTYDWIYASSWAGSSCDNGASFPYSGSGSNSNFNSNFVSASSTSVYMPACSSSPKYRSKTSHQWDDGLWSTSKSQTWNQ